MRSPLEQAPQAILEEAAALLRFAMSASSGATAGGSGARETRARLMLADAHLGVSPFEGIRVDQFELDAGSVRAEEIAAGPAALKNRRTEITKLHFSIDEAAVARMLLANVEPDSGIETVSVRFFPDHVRIYLELNEGMRARAILCASVDVDESGSFVLSFYDIRVFGRLLPGNVPSSILDRLLPAAGSRFVTREGATRVVLQPHAILLTAWLPAAGWKVPDHSRALDRHVALRGERLYVRISQTSTPGLVSESTTSRDLAAFEYAEAERLFLAGEELLRDGDLEGAAEVYEGYGDPANGHPFALRRLAWIRAAQAGTGPEAEVRAAEARRIAEGLRSRFPGDAVAAETFACLSLIDLGNQGSTRPSGSSGEIPRGSARPSGSSGEIPRPPWGGGGGTALDRDAAAEAFESLAVRCGEENDLRGRVFAELFLGELYGRPGPGQDLALARSAYEAALALDPECLTARKALADVYVRVSEPANAIEAWTRILETDVPAEERRRLLLRIAAAHLDGLGDAGTAIQVYREAQEGDDPAFPTVAAWEGLARAYAAKGDAPAAIRQLERVADRCTAIGDGKGAARANYAIGELWAEKLNRPESALMRFERALELDPHHVGSLERRYGLDLERKAYAAAVDSGQRLAEALLIGGDELDGAPRIDSASARAVAGQVLLDTARISAEELDDEAGAGAAASRALEIDPDSKAACEACEQYFGAAAEWKGLSVVLARAAEQASPAAGFDLRIRHGKLLAGVLKDLDGAAAEYASAAAIAPDSSRLDQSRELLAAVLRERERFPELRDLRAAQWKTMPPGSERAALALEIGRICRGLDDATTAATWFDRAAEEDPTSGEAYGALAELAAERGDVGGHVQALLRRAGAENDPVLRARLRTEAGNLLLDSMEDPEAAREQAALAIAEEQEPDRGPAGDLGEFPREARRADQTPGEPERADDPIAPDAAWRVLGRAWVALGDADQAAPALEQWFERADRRRGGERTPKGARSGGLSPPERAAMAAEIAAVHALRKDEVSELRWLRIRLEADSIDADATRRAAALARKVAPPEIAAELIEAEANVTSDRALASELFLEAGKIREEAGEIPKAEEAYRAAAAAVPQDETPLDALSGLLLGSGRPDEAVEIWRAAAEDASGMAAAARWRRAAVLASTRLGDAELAGRCFARLLALDPNDKPALSFLAERARAAAAWPKARELYERLAEQTQDASPAECAQLALRRAEAAERDGDPAAAEERYRLSASLLSSREPWKAIRRLAAAAGRHADAAEALEEEAERTLEAGEKANLLFEAGRIALERLNEPKRASVRFREALDLVPGNVPALDALEAISTTLEDWGALVRILREKATLLRDARRRADLLRRAAEVAWERLGDVELAAEDAMAARAAHAGDPRPLLLLEKIYRAERLWDRLAPLLEERARGPEGSEESPDRAGVDPASREAWIVEAAGIRARELGDYDRAASDLERALLEGMAGRELLALLADVQEKRGEPARVANALARLVPMLDGKEKGEAQLRLARVYGDAMEDEATGLRWMAEAYQSAPEDREVALEYRQRLAGAERWNELAEIELGVAERSADPKEAAAGYRRAATIFRGRMDDAAAAVKAYRKALASDPDDSESLQAADELLIVRGDHATRADLYRERIKAAPDDAVAREGLLAAMAAGGKWSELEAELKPFADAEPVGGPSARRLLVAYRSAGRWRDLVRFLEARVTAGEAAAREPLEAVFAEREDWRGLADFHLRQAEGKTGRERARTVAQAAAVLRERMNDLDRSREVLREAVAQRPDDVELFEAAAEAFESAGDMEGMRDLLVDAAESARGPARSAHLRRAATITRERLGDATRALALWREVVAADPDDDQAGEAAAEILGARHDWAGVVALWYERAEKGKDPKRRSLYYRTAGGLAKTRLADPVRAASAYRAALVIDPDDAEAAEGAMEALEAAERWDELASLRAARGSRAGTGQERARALMSAAVVARDRLKDPEKALDYFRLAVAECPEDTVAIDAAATLLAQLERWNELADWLLSTTDGLVPREAAQRRLSAAEILLDNLREDPASESLVVEAVRRNLAVPDSADASSALRGAVALLENREAWGPLFAVYEKALEESALALQRGVILSAMGALQRDRLGDRGKSAELFRRALELDPANGRAFAALDQWYRETEDWDACLAIYEADAGFATEAGHKAGRYVAMADIREQELGDRAGAARELKRALEATPGDAQLALRYERTLEQAGVWEELVEAWLARSARSSAPASAAGLQLRAADLIADKLADPARAVELYEQARKNAPHPDEPLLGLERVFRKTQDFRKLVGVLEARGSLPGGGVERARLLLEAGVLRRARLDDPNGALALLKASLELDPDSVEAHRELREIYRSRGQWVAVDETLEAEEALSAGEPDELRAALAYERGLVFRDGFKDPPRAVFHLARAVKLDRNDPGSARALAEVSEQIKAFGTAREEWRRLASNATGESRIEFLEAAARCAVADRDPAGAVELLEDTVEVDPERLESWDRLADAYLSMRRWDEARLVLGELLARSSKVGDAARTITIYYRLGRAERLLGHTEKASGRLKRLLSADPNHAGALELLADIHREREEWGPFSEVLTRLAEASPKEQKPRVLLELGMTFEHRLGRPAEAMEAYGRTLREAPDDYEALWRLSDLAFQHGRHDVFLQAWARLSDREKAPARKLALAFRAGESLKRSGRPQEAAREYEKAIELDHTHLASWMALAGLLEEMREWRRAVAAYDGALRVIGAEPQESTPGTRIVQVLVRRGILLAERVGEYGGAAEDLKRAVDLVPDDLPLRFRLAGVLAKAKGRTMDAIHELQEILRRDPFRAEAYRSLGEIHVGSQSLDRAFAAFSALHVLDPSNVSAKSFLDANRSKIEQAMLKAVDETTRAELLTHPTATAEPIRTGMMVLADAVSSLYPQDIDRTGLVAIDLASGTPLARMIDSIRARLGLSSLTLFVRPAAVPSRRDSVADLLTVDTGEHPSLIVDDTLAAAIPDRRGALFVLGKFLERLKGGHAVFTRLSPEEVDQLAVLIRTAFDPAAEPAVAPGLPPEAAAAMVKALRKQAPRKSRKEIEEMAASLDAKALHAWIEGLRHSENRAGLLLASDLGQAARVSLALDPGLGKVDPDAVPDRVAHLKKSDEVAEMLRFATSDDFLNLRRAVGLTLENQKR